MLASICGCKKCSQKHRSVNVRRFWLWQRKCPLPHASRWYFHKDLDVKKDFNNMWRLMVFSTSKSKTYTVFSNAFLAKWEGSLAGAVMMGGWHNLFVSLRWQTTSKRSNRKITADNQKLILFHDIEVEETSLTSLKHTTPVLLTWKHFYKFH